MLALAGTSAVPRSNGFVSHWRGSSALSKDVSNEGGFVRSLLHAADTGAALFLCLSVWPRRSWSSCALTARARHRGTGGCKSHSWWLQAPGCHCGARSLPLATTMGSPTGSPARAKDWEPVWEKSRLLSPTKRLLKLRKQSGITKRAVCSLLEHFIKYFHLFFLTTEKRSRAVRAARQCRGSAGSSRRGARCR